MVEKPFIEAFPARCQGLKEGLLEDTMPDPNHDLGDFFLPVYIVLINTPGRAAAKTARRTILAPSPTTVERLADDLLTFFFGRSL